MGRAAAKAHVAGGEGIVSTAFLLVAAGSAGSAFIYAAAGWPRTSRILAVVAAVSAVAYAATGGPFS